MAAVEPTDKSMPAVMMTKVIDLMDIIVQVIENIMKSFEISQLFLAASLAGVVSSSLGYVREF